MGGIIGRLFGNSLTVTASIAVSALVSLTLAPMLLPLHARESDEHGRVYRVIEAGFNACWRSTGARSTSCCATRP